MQHLALFVYIGYGHHGGGNGPGRGGLGRCRDGAYIHRGQDNLGVVVQLVQGVAASNAVHRQVVIVLETLHRPLGVAAENAIGSTLQVPKFNQSALQGAHVFAPVAGAHRGQAGVYRCGAHAGRRHHQGGRGHRGGNVGGSTHHRRRGHQVHGRGCQRRGLLHGRRGQQR